MKRKNKQAIHVWCGKVWEKDNKRNEYEKWSVIKNNSLEFHLKSKSKRNENELYVTNINFLPL